MRGIHHFIKKICSLGFAILVIAMLQTTAISADTIHQTFSIELADIPNQTAVLNQTGATNQADSKSSPAQTITTGNPVHTVQEARNLLLYIIAAEGLKPSKLMFQRVDDYGNYYFDVWYTNFPHNTREVTHDGYVVEDHD